MEIRPLDLELLVHDALSNAVQSGFADALADMSDEEVAVELIDIDSRFEHFNAADITPHVQTWRAKT